MKYVAYVRIVRVILVVSGSETDTRIFSVFLSYGIKVHWYTYVIVVVVRSLPYSRREPPSHRMNQGKRKAALPAVAPLPLGDDEEESGDEEYECEEQVQDTVSSTNCDASGGVGSSGRGRGKPMHEQIVAVRQTGLVQMLGASTSAKPQAKVLKRAVPPGSVWNFVEVEEVDQKKWVKCKFCNMVPFQVSGATRIIDHFLGRPGIRACSGGSGESDVFNDLVIRLQEEASAKLQKKQRKTILACATELGMSDAAEVVRGKSGMDPAANTVEVKREQSTAKPVARLGSKGKGFSQPPLQMGPVALSEDVDEAIGRFFYGHNVSARLVE